MSSVAIARPRTLVLADLLPGTLLRDVLLVVGGAGFVGALAQISIPLHFTPVPITGQTLGVLLAGAALGWRRAAASMALYAIAGVAGVPWFAGHTQRLRRGHLRVHRRVLLRRHGMRVPGRPGRRPLGAAGAPGHAGRRGHHLRVRPDLAGARPALERVGHARGRIHAVPGWRCHQGCHRRRLAARRLEAGRPLRA